MVKYRRTLLRIHPADAPALVLLPFRDRAVHGLDQTLPTSVSSTGLSAVPQVVYYVE